MYRIPLTIRPKQKERTSATIIYPKAKELFELPGLKGYVAIAAMLVSQTKEIIKILLLKPAIKKDCEKGIQ